jgi:hypothetical protein
MVDSIALPIIFVQVTVFSFLGVSLVELASRIRERFVLQNRS